MWKFLLAYEAIDKLAEDRRHGMINGDLLFFEPVAKIGKTFLFEIQRKNTAPFNNAASISWAPPLTLNE